MRYISSGKNEKAFGLLFQKICGRGDTFEFHPDGLSLLKSLPETDDAGVLIILEYDVFKGFSDFIFDFLSMRGLRIPLILVGNPPLRTGEQSMRWISENEFQYDVQNFHLLHPLLRRVSDALRSDEVHAVFSEKDSLRETAWRLRGPAKNPIAAVQEKINLPAAAYNLLCFLYKNRLRDVSVSEIERHLFTAAGSDMARRNVVYAYISRIRKSFEKLPVRMIEIVRTKKGFYRLFFR